MDSFRITVDLTSELVFALNEHADKEGYVNMDTVVEQLLRQALKMKSLKLEGHDNADELAPTTQDEDTLRDARVPRDHMDALLADALKK